MTKDQLKVSQDQTGWWMVYVHHLDNPKKVNGPIFHALALWSLGWGALHSPGSLESWLNRTACSPSWGGRGIQVGIGQRVASNDLARSWQELDAQEKKKEPFSLKSEPNLWTIPFTWPLYWSSLLLPLLTFLLCEGKGKRIKQPQRIWPFVSHQQLLSPLCLDFITDVQKYFVSKGGMKGRDPRLSLE